MENKRFKPVNIEAMHEDYAKIERNAKIMRMLILKPLMVITLPIALLYRIYKWVWDGTIFGIEA